MGNGAALRRQYPRPSSTLRRIVGEREFQPGGRSNPRAERAMQPRAAQHISCRQLGVDLGDRVGRECGPTVARILRDERRAYDLAAHACIEEKPAAELKPILPIDACVHFITTSFWGSVYSAEHPTADWVRSAL